MTFLGTCPNQEFGVILLMKQQDLKFTLTKAGMRSLESLVNQNKECVSPFRPLTFAYKCQ